MWVLCAGGKRRRNERYCALVHYAESQLAFGGAQQANSRSRGLQNQRLGLQKRENENDLESANACRATMPAVHDLPRSRLLQCLCAMPACSTVHRPASLEGDMAWCSALRSCLFPDQEHTKESQ